MIGVDTFEPLEIELTISKSVNTIRDSFNAKDLPDYNWIAVDGHRIGVSRKQAGELLSSLDEVEVQLRKEMVTVDEMYLLNEGMFSGVLLDGRPGTQVWYPSKDGHFLLPGHKFHTSLAMFYAWIYQLDKCGVTYLPTFDWEETATALVAIYKSSQKVEHTTLTRYIKQKITPKPHNHHIESLMGIKGKGRQALLGETKATALVERYGTVWMVLAQDAEELAKTEGIGLVAAKKLLGAIGRNV